LVHDELALRLVRLWLDYAVWNGLRLHRPDLDLPLGAVVSPMLANLLLDDLDEALLGAGLEMVRYAGRVTLKPEAFRRWLEGYEAALTEARASAPLGVRAALAAEAEKFARALRENGTFQPWREIRCSMSSPMTSPTATAAGVCSSR
jgi:hypothetical protein